MLQLEKTLLCKQSSECAFCLWVCLLYWCRKCQMCIIYHVYPCNSLSISALRGADLWRTGRSTIIMHRQLGHFIFFGLYPRPVRRLSLTTQSSTLETRSWFKVWSPVFFWMLSVLFLVFLRSTDVWISSSCWVVSILDLHQLHSFRLSWTHAFDCEYIFHLDFASWR